MPGTWTTRRASLDDDLDVLLGYLCTEWGYCNAPTAKALLQANAVLTAEDFAVAVLRAEGLNPEYEKGMRRDIAERFRDRYGPMVSETTFSPDLPP
jgi:hypothetical protein